MKMYDCCFKLLFLFFSSYHIYHIASAGCYSSFWSFSFKTGLKSRFLILQSVNDMYDGIH